MLLRAKYILSLGFALFCQNFFSQSVGGTTSGAATFCGVSSAGFISVTSFSGTIQYWESSTNGGASWTNIGNPTSSQSYSSLTQTTCYRAVVQNGGFPADTSSVSCITVMPPTVAGTTGTGGAFCGSTGPGTVTLTGNTGSVLNWLESTNGGASWTSIPNTTTTLTYTNLTTSTLYAAVVQNSSFCAIDTSTITSFTIDAPPVVGSLSASPNDSVCLGINSCTLTLSGYTGQISGWLSSTNGGASWTSISNTTPVETFFNLTQNTLYEVILTNGVCPADTSPSIGITVVPIPTVNAGADSSILPGQTVNLNGTGNGTPLWIPAGSLSNPTIFNPVASPTVTTGYILLVSNSFGCVNADTVFVFVGTPIFNGTVSTYFTPNGDGINDTWYIQNIQNFPGNEVLVYNIYGQEVYTKKDYQNDWKGTSSAGDLPDGTYYYVLKFDGTSKIYKGSLDLIRKK